MPRILTSGAVFSKVRVSPNALVESHSICSAAGAIYAYNVNQLNGTLMITNSLAQQSGGAGGAPWSTSWGNF